MRIICIVFILVGVVLLVIGSIWAYRTQNFLDKSLETRGFVIDLSWESGYAHPVFRFVDERTGEAITIVSDLGSKPPAYSIGQEVYILYDAQDPHNAIIKSFWNIWFGSIIVTSLGGIFLSVGLIPFGFDIRRRRLVEYLKTEGEIIYGEVVKIYQDTSFTVQGQHPWHIAVRWPNPKSGRLHFFKSDHIWYDPSDFVRIGEEMEVHVDPKNPKKHWVNINHLPRREEVIRYKKERSKRLIGYVKNWRKHVIGVVAIIGVIGLGIISFATTAYVGYPITGLFFVWGFGLIAIGIVVRKFWPQRRGSIGIWFFSFTMSEWLSLMIYGIFLLAIGVFLAWLFAAAGTRL